MGSNAYLVVYSIMPIILFHCFSKYQRDGHFSSLLQRELILCHNVLHVAMETSVVAMVARFPTLLSLVSESVFTVGGQMSEGFTTVLTLERFFSCVSANVGLKSAPLGETS